MEMENSRCICLSLSVCLCPKINKFSRVAFFSGLIGWFEICFWYAVVIFNWKRCITRKYLKQKCALMSFGRLDHVNEGSNFKMMMMNVNQIQRAQFQCNDRISCVNLITLWHWSVINLIALNIKFKFFRNSGEKDRERVRFDCKLHKIANHKLSHIFWLLLTAFNSIDFSLSADRKTNWISCEPEHISHDDSFSKSTHTPQNESEGGIERERLTEKKDT